jgi:chromosome segregation ATPase
VSIDREEITERLAAVERRLTDDADPAADAASVAARVSALEARADDLDDRLAAVESGLDALRGLVGEVERVDDRVERRADAAVARTDDLAERVAALEAARESTATRTERVAREAGTTPEGSGETADRQAAADDRPPLARLRDALP